MNVSLTPELEAWIQDRVQTGRYRSFSEVVREAIRLLQEHEEIKHLRLEELRRLVQVGLDDMDAGRVVEFTPDVTESIKRRGRKRLAGSDPE